MQRARLVARTARSARSRCKPVRAGPACAALSAAWRSRSGAQLALQRHLVGRRLGVDHHQVAGHAAPGPQAQRLAPASAAGPGPGIAPAETSTIGRSPEMPKRHSTRRSHTSPAAARRGRGGAAGASGVSTSAVVRVWIAAKVLGADAQRAQADAGQRGRHQRGALARGWAGGTCRSPRAACRALSQAAVAKVSAALRAAARCAAAPTARRPGPGRCRARRRLGAASGQAGSNEASGCAGARGCGRASVGGRSGSARSSTWASLPARKCAACSACSVARRGLRSNTQRLVRGAPVRAHEQVGEGRVRFVGARVGQRDLEGRDQLDRRASRRPGCAARPGGTRCRLPG